MTPVTQTTHPSKLWQGFWGIQVLHVGQSLDLFEALLVEMTPATLASERGLDARYTALWCEAAESYGMLEATDGRYRTVPEHAEWLEDSKGFTHSHLHLARRTNETLEAVFGKRALPEPQISVRLLLQDNLQANYQWLFQEAINRSPTLEKLLHQKGRVLEIGCGAGFGLAHLRKFYPNLDLFGLEADYECAQEAERSTKAVIHVGELPDKRFSKGFDLIVCFRTLSSALEPCKLLSQASSLLNDNGFFLLGTETLDDSEYRKGIPRVYGERLAYNILAGESLRHTFSEQDVQRLLTDNRFNIIAQIEAPDWATPAYLCQLEN